MSSFSEMWPNAKVNDGGESNVQPPDEGDYFVVLTGGGAFTSKSGKDLIKLELRVTDGPSAGYEWTEFRNFDSQGAANAAKTTCARMGIDVEQVASLADLDAEIKALGGYAFAVKVARNGEYLNTYIEERHDAGVPRADEAPAAPVAAGGIPTDDVPF